jgi:hypothetical protein
MSERFNNNSEYNDGQGYLEYMRSIDRARMHSKLGGIVGRNNEVNTYCPYCGEKRKAGRCGCHDVSDDYGAPTG